MTKYKVWFLYKGRLLWRTSERLYDTREQAHAAAANTMQQNGCDGVYIERIAE